MAGTETKRIIELTEASTIQSGDFIAVDSNARGTKKVPTDTLATSAALTAETNARAGADEQMSERMDGIEEQTALIQNPTKTLSGALCSFTDGADMPMVACTAEIVPKQSGTGTPSPDNVRQISGWESVSVNVTGVNVWDEEWELGGYSTANGEKATQTNTIRSTNAISVKPNTSYHVSVFGLGAIYLFYYDKNGNYVGNSGGYVSNGAKTMPNNVYQMRFQLNPAYGTTYNNDISINYPSTDTNYHAYNGTTKTVSLGRTVYGGTLDVVSGVLTVDRAYVDLGTLNWYKVSDCFYSFLPIGNDPKANVTCICSQYTYSQYSQGDARLDYTINTANSYFGARTVSVKDTRYSSAADFKSAMSGVQLVYELATPQTYTLTPTEVQTLLGENNVWADSGDVEITYRRDISIVLENLENALSGSNSLNTMMMSAPTENTAEEPTEDEAEDDMR